MKLNDSSINQMLAGVLEIRKNFIPNGYCAREKTIQIPVSKPLKYQRTTNTTATLVVKY